MEKVTGLWCGILNENCPREAIGQCFKCINTKPLMLHRLINRVCFSGGPYELISKDDGTTLLFKTRTGIIATIKSGNLTDSIGNMFPRK